PLTIGLLIVIVEFGAAGIKAKVVPPAPVLIEPVPPRFTLPPSANVPPPASVTTTLEPVIALAPMVLGANASVEPPSMFTSDDDATFTVVSNAMNAFPPVWTAPLLLVPLPLIVSDSPVNVRATPPAPLLSDPPAFTVVLPTVEPKAVALPAKNVPA